MSAGPFAPGGDPLTVLGPGDTVPDLTLLDPDGAAVSLVDAARGDTLLIFLRHLM